MYQFEKDIESVLADETTLSEICDRLAAQITKDYENSGRDLILVTVLKGSVFFATDLMRRIPLKCEIEFMKVSSYGAGTETSGFIQVHLDLKRDVSGADVIIIEDIIDSGRTLQKLSQLMEGRGANSVRCCTLLDKPERRQVNLNADYVGMEIPDAFVVGYGLDYDEKYRNLSYVGVLKPSVYQK
ncbi:MAG: hypoxanthine phosphoribosyltransferase [Clostridia bacterium]|nr:hypoxanthine phosphoribosyltransferase [Clostridia bacterium]